MGSNHGDVAERTVAFVKAEPADVLDKFPVITAIEYGVISAVPVQFNQVVDFRADAGACKFSGALAAGFLVLAEQDMAPGLLQNAQDHVNAGPVIAADTLRGHHDTAILGVADMFCQLAVNRVHVGDQHNWNLAGGVEESFFGRGLIAQRLQFTYQRLFQTALGELKNLFKFQGAELTL